jgi:hypothetical protein
MDKISQMNRITKKLQNNSKMKTLSLSMSQSQSKRMTAMLNDDWPFFSIANK